MRKLSSKLLLALGVIILSLIIWQVIVSKRVIGDMEKIKQLQSIEQIHDLLKNKELVTYNAVSCHSFSKIRFDRVDVCILKGNEYEIYVSDYCKRYIEFVQDGEELLIKALNKEAFNSYTPVFIFMPEDPQLVYCTKPDCYFIGCKIYGFRGDNTLFSCEEVGTRITTDMPFININQKNSWLDICISGLDSSLRINHVQMNVHAENSKLNFNDWDSDSIDANIQLKESAVEHLTINSNSKVGTLSLKGSLCEKDDYKALQMKINYPGQCDSLIIQLTSNQSNAKQLSLSKGLSGRYENISCSPNVAIYRGE